MAHTQLSFPIPEPETDEGLGKLALEETFFQRKPPLEFVRNAGHRWFVDNRAAVRAFLVKNPTILEFFSAHNERRNEILSAVGDVVMVAGVGIPVLLLLSKIAHYGVDKLVREPEQPPEDHEA